MKTKRKDYVVSTAMAASFVSGCENVTYNAFEADPLRGLCTKM